MRKGLIIFAIIFLMVLSSGCIEEMGYDLKPIEKIEKKETNTDFLKEYSIALIHIHTASNYLDLANNNLDFVEYYALGEEYYYSDAEQFYDTGKTYTLDSKELLLKAKKKLENIQNNTPNTFFKKDVANRIEQTDILLLVAEDTYSLLDYSNRQLYEINYGSENKATEYFNKYNDVIPTLNSNYKKLSDIQNEIDLEWDQDWYITFQEEVESSETKYL